MTIGNAIASVAVKHLPAAARWYESLLQKAADSTPMPGVAEWKFPRGGWLQVYQLPERAGNGSVTLAVSDMDDVLSHVKHLGIDTSQTSSSPKAETLTIVDPDGNHITFAHALDPSMAR